MFTFAISRQFSASAESLLGLPCLSSGVMGHNRAFSQPGTALRPTLSCTLAFILSPAELYMTSKSSCEMFAHSNSCTLGCMGSPPPSHQFLKSTSAAEEHLEKKPHYAWRPGGAGNALFWIPVTPARSGDMSGRTRRRAASECSISCYVLQAKSPTVQVPQAHGAHVLPRLPVNNLTF